MIVIYVKSVYQIPFAQTHTHTYTPRNDIYFTYNELIRFYIETYI